MSSRSLTGLSVAEITQELVRIPSVNPVYDPASAGEGGVVRWLQTWADAEGFESWTEEVSPGRENFFIAVENGAASPHLLLNGHTDTVAIGGMTIEPFSGEIRDGRIWGRGSADMKGPLAAMMVALRTLRGERSSWRGKITLAFVVDEEVAFAGVNHLVASHRDFDFAVVGEPTAMKVIRGSKGVLRAKVEAHGLSAHSSRPKEGRSAIVAMAEAILALDDFFANGLTRWSSPHFGSSTGSVGLIQGGTGVNIVPERCEVEVDVRMLPGQSWEETHARLCEVICGASSRVPGIQWRFPKPFADEAYEIGEDHPLAVHACRALGVPGPEVAQFTCDASKIARAGIPCIVAGPGDIREAHTARESIAISDLEDGVAGFLALSRALLPAGG